MIRRGLLLALAAPALLSAADAIAAGSAGRVLVLAADCRLAAPNSPLERNVADGAAALLLSGREVVAALRDRVSISDEIIDVWRTDRDPFVQSWEERFVVDHGYKANLTEAVKGLLAQAGRLEGPFVGSDPAQRMIARVHQRERQQLLAGAPHARGIDVRCFDVEQAWFSAARPL